LDALGQGAMEALGQTPERGLRLAILPTFGTRWLMPRIPRFVRRHPEITLHLTTRIGRFDLTAEGVDAAIHSGQGDWPGARLTRLMDEAVIPVAAPGVRGVAGQPLLALATRPQAWPAWWAQTGQPGPVPAPAMRLEQVSTLAQAAAAGMGVALMPAFLIRPELETGALVPLGAEIATGFGYFLAEPLPAPGLRPKPAVALFRDWLITETDRDTVV
ncbi:MAG: LysR substrate-binding domain-containing protein, partial [Pararhodobacter sp.]